MAHASLSGLTLHVKDIERSLEFYRRVPDVEVIYHQGQFALLRIGGGRLGLLQLDVGRFHMEIETDDLDAIYSAVRAAGIEPESPPALRSWGHTDFEVMDPDGNMIEFAHADH